MFGDEALPLFLASLPKNAKILDIGAGRENGVRNMAILAGHEYEVFDFATGKDWEVGPFKASLHDRYDGIWMSHVLEHLLDVNHSLLRVGWALKPGGILCITVPPAKPEIVGGHVSLWNAGLLLYRLVLAGFDCSQAAVKTYGYNISVLLRYKWAELPVLQKDAGDIEALAHLFPFPVKQGFNGNIQTHNWGTV